MQVVDFLLSGDGAMALTFALFAVILVYFQFAPNEFDPKVSETLKSPMTEKLSVKLTPPEKRGHVAHSAPRHTKVVPTAYGDVKVTIVGHLKSTLYMVTIHDVGLTHRACFNPLFQLPCKSLSCFSIYHIDLPGQYEQDGPLKKALDFDALVGVIEQVRKHFNMPKFLGMGVGIGSQLLLRYATQYSHRMQGMILMGASRHGASFSESLSYSILSSILRYSGISSMFLSGLSSYMAFSSHFLHSQSRMAQGHLRGLRDIEIENLINLLQACRNRKALSREQLSSIYNIPTLLVAAGQRSQPFPLLEFSSDEENVMDLLPLLNKRTGSWIKIYNSGRVISCEAPEGNTIPRNRVYASRAVGTHNFILEWFGILKSTGYHSPIVPQTQSIPLPQ